MEPVTLDRQGAFVIAIVSTWTFRVLPDHKPIPSREAESSTARRLKKLVIVEVNGNER